MKIETICHTVGPFSITLFIEDCRQHVETGLQGLLKIFVSAKVLYSQIGLQLQKKVKVTWWQVWAVRWIIEYFLPKLRRKLLDHRTSQYTVVGYPESERFRKTACLFFCFGRPSLHATYCLTIHSHLERESIIPVMWRELQLMCWTRLWHIS